jgi:AcrR family transcriptional regulator
MSMSSNRGVSKAKRKTGTGKPRAGNPNGKRAQNKAQNREAIMIAAREVFTELGYDAATVRDIIRRTKLASGTFYNYFIDKETVFRNLLRDSEERRLEWLRRVQGQGANYEKYLRETFRAYFEFVVADRTTFDLIRRNAGTIRGFALDRALVDERERLRRSLHAGMQAGLIPAVDLEFLASAIYGISFEVAVIMVERDPADIEGATNFMTDLFFGFFSRARKAEKAVDKSKSSGTVKRRPT